MASASSWALIFYGWRVPPYSRVAPYQTPPSNTSTSNSTQNSIRQSWDEADEAFRIPEKQQQLPDVLQTVHTKLGSAGVASLTNINVNANSRGTFVTTVYSTVFARDEVVETFTWTKKNDRLKLYGYHVDSKVFATKQ